MSCELPIDGPMHIQIPKTMTDCYKSLYYAMKEHYDDKILSCFFPMAGSKYFEYKQIKKEAFDNIDSKCLEEINELLLEPSVRLMIVGRSPNGWGETGFASFEQFKRLMEESILPQDDAKEGFFWLMDNGLGKETYLDPKTGKDRRYNINGSAFFRVTRSILAGLKPETKYIQRWFEYYLWTNLYCFSPKDGGNATSKMIKIQLQECRKLLLAQIDFYRPTHILFITDWKDWFELFADLFDNVKQFGDSKIDNVVAKGKYCNTKIVVSIRPDRTKPNKPNEEQYAKDILRAFATIPDM